MSAKLSHPENLQELLKAAKVALSKITMFHMIQVEIFLPNEEITIGFSINTAKDKVTPLVANHAITEIYQFQRALENSLSKLGYKDPVIKIVPTMILPTPNNIQTFDIIVGDQWSKKL